MGFATKSKLAAVVSSGGGGGYLNPSKVQAGTSKRFKILSDAPLDSWCVWGEDPSGACKPFRFDHDPSPAEIEEKMGGDYVRRMNREGTAPEAVKPGMSFFVYEYDSSSVMLCEFTQKSLIKELLSIASLEEYENLEEWDFTWAVKVLAWPLSTACALSPPRKARVLPLLRHGRQHRPRVTPLMLY